MVATIQGSTGLVWAALPFSLIYLLIWTLWVQFLAAMEKFIQNLNLGPLRIYWQLPCILFPFLTTTVSFSIITSPDLTFIFNFKFATHSHFRAAREASKMDIASTVVCANGILRWTVASSGAYLPRTPSRCEKNTSLKCENVHWIVNMKFHSL